MAGQQNHALAASQRLIEMIDSFKPHQPPQLLIRRPPGHRGFKQTNAERGEMRLQQGGPFSGRAFRETQIQIDRGDPVTVAGELADPAAYLPADGELPAKRQHRH